MNPTTQEIYFLNHISQGHIQIQLQFILHLAKSLCFTEKHADAGRNYHYWASEANWSPNCTAIGGSSIPVNKQNRAQERDYRRHSLTCSFMPSKKHTTTETSTCVSIGLLISIERQHFWLCVNSQTKERCLMHLQTWQIRIQVGFFCQLEAFSWSNFSKCLLAFLPTCFVPPIPSTCSSPHKENISETLKAQ